MRKHAFALGIAVGLLGCCPVTRAAVVLAGPDVKAGLYVPAKATTAETFAAGELRKYLQQMTGAQWAVVPEGAAPAGAAGIYVGRTAFAEKHGIRCEAAESGREGFVIQTADGGVAIVGADELGQLYGAYAFLEDLGVAWFTRMEDGPFVPKLNRVIVGDVDRRERPAIAFRSMFWRDVPNTEADVLALIDWMLKNRLNSGSSRAAARRTTWSWPCSRSVAFR